MRLGRPRKFTPLQAKLNKLLANIRERCINPRAAKYSYYGGRGIKNFLILEDLELLWKRDHAELLLHPSIDRIDANNHYEITNCRFIERHLNMKRRTAKPKTVSSLTIVEMGRLGGLARAKRLTAKQRSVSARKAALARWKKESA